MNVSNTVPTLKVALVHLSLESCPFDYSIYAFLYKSKFCLCTNKVMLTGNSTLPGMSLNNTRFKF